MAGIDVDVLDAQVYVLREGIAIHRDELQAAEQAHIAALTVHQRALDMADSARSAADRAATLADHHRRAIRDSAADIAEIQQIKALIPTQRPPS